MAKNHKKLKWLAVSAVLLLALAGFTKFAGIELQSAMTILSVDRVDLVKDDPAFGKDAWLVTFALPGASSSIKGILSKQKLGLDNTTDSAYEFIAEALEERIEYPIVATGESVYGVEVSSKEYSAGSFVLNYLTSFTPASAPAEVQGSGILLEDYNNCRAKPGAFYWAKRELTTYCFTKTEMAKVGMALTPRVIFNATFALATPRGVITRTVTNAAGPSVEFTDSAGKKIAILAWVGDLTGVSVPEASDLGKVAYVPVRITEDGRQYTWTNINDEAYSRYLINDQSDFLRCVNDYIFDGVDSVQACVNTRTDLANQATLPQAFAVRDASGLLVEAVQRGTPTSTQGVLVADVANLIGAKVFTLKINAESAGISTLTGGRPEIVAVKLDKKIKSGEINRGYIDIKNIGATAGQFAVSNINCQKAKPSEARTVMVDVGKTESVPFTLTAEERAEAEGRCTAYAYNTVNASANASKTYTFGIEPIVIDTCREKGTCPPPPNLSGAENILTIRTEGGKAVSVTMERVDDRRYYAAPAIAPMPMLRPTVAVWNGTLAGSDLGTQDWEYSLAGRLAELAGGAAQDTFDIKELLFTLDTPFAEYQAHTLSGDSDTLIGGIHYYRTKASGKFIVVVDGERVTKEPVSEFAYWSLTLKAIGAVIVLLVLAVIVIAGLGISKALKRGGRGG